MYEQWHNDLTNPITNDDALKEFEKARKEWDELKRVNPKFNEYVEKIKTHAREFNSHLESKYTSAASFYRGTSLDELESYLKHGIIGSNFFDMVTGESRRNYSFVSASMSMEDIGLFNRGVIIEYDGDSVRNTNSKRVEYSAEPVPFLSSYHKKDVNDVEGFDAPNSMRFMDEEEVRLPTGLQLGKDIKIKKIHIDANKIEGQLRSVLGLPNPANTEDFGKWEDYELVKQKLHEKFGVLGDNIILHRNSLWSYGNKEEWLNAE